MQGRKRLPIYAYREEFLEAVRDNKIIVVVGETGSGMNKKIRIFHMYKSVFFYVLICILIFISFIYLFIFDFFVLKFFHPFRENDSDPSVPARSGMEQNRYGIYIHVHCN